ncbi:MAG: chorismate mutase [Acidimicrobiales bacterium]
MAAAVRALRGATRVDADTRDQVTTRVGALVRAMLDRNGVDLDDLISIVFTATDDIHSMFPAEAARALGLGDVPLLCAQELDIDAKPTLCIRVLMHLTTTRSRSELQPVYLEGTSVLRDDLDG